MENQTTELVVVSAELEAVVSSNSSIEITKAQAHALSFAPAMNQVHELSKALSTMDKENPSETDAKVARINRLAMVKNRTATAKIKDELKANLLTETKLIDSLHNVVKHTSELTEAEYEKIEKFAENREKERKEKLFNERLSILSEVTEQASIYPLGDMDDDSFNQLVDAMKLQKEAKEKALKEAEQARIEAEKQAEAEIREAKRIADEQAEAQRLENIRLTKENEAKEKQLAEERLKAENERKAEAEKQAKIQAQKDAELEKQQAEKAELEKQLQDKKDAELKAENERKAQILAEEKAKKELLKSGDKAILNNWIDKFNIEPIEQKGLSKEAVIKSNEIYSKFQAFQKWAREQAESI